MVGDPAMERPPHHSGFPRREFVHGAAGLGVAAGCGLSAAHAPSQPAALQPPAPGRGPIFATDDATLQSKWDAAVAGLRRNVVRVFKYDRPVLIEGAGYPGIWLECGPLESLAFLPFAPEVAFASHDIFFALQREDGYFPCYVWAQKIGSAQIQMVVPIAATALEVAVATRDDRLLSRAYAACSRWDAWLVRHRNTRGTGLCEAFCGYDTGHDNSPRFAGLPWECADHDARKLPDPGARRGGAGLLPFLAPDLSASVYGGRLALAKMAQKLGKLREEARWLEQADAIRKAIFKHCYDADDACFYDRDADDKFVRIRHDGISRVLGEHVADQTQFDEIYRRHLRNPEEFWTSYPFPSVAVNDAACDKRFPANSWGGASQALTALRAPRWMEHYGRRADLSFVMQRWVQALCAAPEFMQQMDPWTGAMSTSKNYSPAMLVLVDFVTRLHGISRIGDTLEWNCRLPAQAHNSYFRLPLRERLAEMEVTEDAAYLALGGEIIASVRGAVRVRTDLAGKPLALIGTEAETVTVQILREGRGDVYTVAADTTVAV
jgi:hypothetical protein